MSKKLFLIMGLLTALSAMTVLKAYAEKPSQSALDYLGPLYLSVFLNRPFGIVDNTSLDAVSGATKLSVSAGLKAEISPGSRRHFIETGTLFTYLPQSITYNAPALSINGKRDFALFLVRIPLAYNLHFFEMQDGEFLFNLKIGLYFSFIPYSKISGSGALPPYTLSKNSRELFIGLSVFPFGTDFGFSAEACRGTTAFYEDMFHSHGDEGRGDLSGFSFGLLYRIK